MLALFLGAGFAKWSYDLPLVKELFDFNIYIRGPREEAKLALPVRVQNVPATKPFGTLVAILIERHDGFALSVETETIFAKGIEILRFSAKYCSLYSRVIPTFFIFRMMLNTDYRV